jgi:hypothetical protein
VGGETQACCVCLLTSSGKDPESGDYTRVCTTFGLGLVKTECDTSKIHEGELCRGGLHPSNEQPRKANCLDKRTNRPRGVCREARCEWTSRKVMRLPPFDSSRRIEATLLTGGAWQPLPQLRPTTLGKRTFFTHIQRASMRRRPEWSG